MCVLTCAYQGVRNVSFPENFAYVLSEWSHILLGESLLEWLKKISAQCKLFWIEDDKDIGGGGILLAIY